MHHIFARGVAPVHRAPYFRPGVILVEQMVGAIVKHHPVRIVHPVRLWREMELGTVLFGGVLGICELRR
ncbi:hypothetical protein D3C87_2173720 [compost metagenome]